MTTAFAVLAVLGLVAVAILLAGRGGDDRPTPVFVTDGRCPMCGHRLDRHRPGHRSGVYRSCTARGCDCDTPLEDLPTVGDGAG